MSRDICFFEPNEVLAERLVDYWMAHGLGQYSVICYSDEKLFLERCATLSVALWILDVRIKEKIPIKPSVPVLWLSESPDDVNAIFKYRSASVLLQAILNCLDIGKEVARSGTTIISFYTPIHRTLQTSFCITLSQLLSRKGHTLYLNLEGYSGFEQMLSGYYSKDISDFIYYFNHSKENPQILTTNFVYRLGNVDMIPPVSNPANLQEITGEMWKRMLNAICDSNTYDYVLIDMDDFVHGTFDILKMSQIIFSFIKSDKKAEAKWQQYANLLEALGCEEIIRKTREIAIPHISSVPTNLEEITPGPFLDYVEQIGKEVGLL